MDEGGLKVIRIHIGAKGRDESMHVFLEWLLSTTRRRSKNKQLEQFYR
jgi:hypothetical protein